MEELEHKLKHPYLQQEARSPNILRPRYGLEFELVVQQYIGVFVSGSNFNFTWYKRSKQDVESFVQVFLKICPTWLSAATLWLLSTLTVSTGNVIFM